MTLDQTNIHSPNVSFRIFNLLLKEIFQLGKNPIQHHLNSVNISAGFFTIMPDDRDLSPA